MSPPPATGRLKVHLETSNAYVAQPINVIDGSSLKLVAATACNEEIEVPAGTYLVSATLPSGERSVGVAEVVSGELYELALGVAELGAEMSAAPTPMSLETLGPADAPPAAEAAPAVASGTWFTRFHVQTPEGSVALTRYVPAGTSIS
ncbi:MAG TPA: hypothetical protein VJK66_05340, partial [Gaiellaceae bacterium]|nr:hypothetical protein [Gaiellaceae bacterium]